MQREEAKERIRAGISCGNYLHKAAVGNYCCPFCGSGEYKGHKGHKPDGALNWYKQTNTFHCFACGKSGDVIDLHMQEYGLDFNAALEDLAGRMGLEIDPWKPGRTTAEEDFREAPSFNGTEDAIKGNAPERLQNAPGGPGKVAGGEKYHKEEEEGLEAVRGAEEAPDYTGYYDACRRRLDDPRAKAYIEGRGISLETARRFWLGYDPQSDPAKSGHPCPRIIIPTTKAHYVGRAIDPGTPAQYGKMNVKGGKPGVFNPKALSDQEAEAVFIVEGAFDALSVAEVGRQAVALNSTNNAAKLIDRLEGLQKEGTITKGTFIICLDEDEAGKKATQVLRDGLTRLNIPFITADISGEGKDPNEALTSDRDAFVAAVGEAVRKAGKRPDNVKDYIDAFMYADIERFRQERKTGFKNLDSLSGGLYGGLYVLAAISSLGKTTLAAQMADQLAEGGNDVLFFSMEQSRLEMVTKSISRTVAQRAMRENRPGMNVSSLSIRKGYLPEQVLQAAKEYSAKVGERLSIVEGNFACDISFIGDYVRRYVQENGVRPVVVVDYLQILQPPADARKGQTTKETVDQTVTAMKRLSRELDIPIIVVSSVNRANYLTPIDFEALKESGGIEFTADVVWGLQLQCMHEEIFSSESKLKDKRERVKEAKAENPRKIELVCLKNRYGIANYSCYFSYYPDRDLYVESAGDEFGAMDATPKEKGRAGKRI